MKPAIILMAALLSLQSCCHKIYPSTSQTTNTTETITEIIRDTVIQTQPDTAILQALIRCDSTGRARLEEINTLKQSARTQQTITIAKDPQPHKPTSITITATVDSMGIYLTYKERYKQTTQTQITETIIEKEVNILKWWQKGLMRIGGITILITAAIVLCSFYKLKKKFSLTEYIGIK